MIIKPSNGGIKQEKSGVYKEVWSKDIQLWKHMPGILQQETKWVYQDNVCK